MNPLFSVLIPVFNREDYVGQAIDSVLSQKCMDYELIVIDDGSTDRTPDVLQTYGSRIKMLRQNNQGAEVARNKAASVAKGEYLVYLDHDDLLLPFALATYKCIIAELGSPPLIIGNMVWFKGQFRSREEINWPSVCEVFAFPDYLAKTVPVSISFSVMIIRRALFDKMGGLTIGSSPLDDLDLMLRVGTTGPCVIIKTPVTVGYRSHAGNFHRDFPSMIRALSFVAKAESRGEYPGGGNRRLDRHAYIGGMSWTWVRHAFKARRQVLAAKLLIKYRSMIVLGAFRKIYSKFFNPPRPHVIPIIIKQEEQ